MSKNRIPPRIGRALAGAAAALLLACGAAHAAEPDLSALSGKTVIFLGTNESAWNVSKRYGQKAYELFEQIAKANGAAFDSGQLFDYCVDNTYGDATNNPLGRNGGKCTEIKAPLSSSGPFSAEQEGAIKSADIIVIFSVSGAIAREKRSFLTALMRNPQNKGQAFLVYADGCFSSSANDKEECTRFEQNFVPFANTLQGMANEGVTDPTQLWGWGMGAHRIYSYYYADLNSASPYHAPFEGVKPRTISRAIPPGDVMGFYNGGAISNVPDKFVLYPLVQAPSVAGDPVALREEADEGHQHAIGVFLPKKRARGGEGACTLFMADAVTG